MPIQISGYIPYIAIESGSDRHAIEIVERQKMTLENCGFRNRIDSSIRIWQDLVRLTDLFPLSDDPPPTSAFKLVYQQGKLRLRHYPAVRKQYPLPLLMVYALLKRPFILDLQTGHSVVENFVNQGFDVYLTDWIAPGPDDGWRGFDAYASNDLAGAVEAVQSMAKTGQISLFGYSFGGPLAALHAALEPERIRNLVTLGLPVDTSANAMGCHPLLIGLSPAMADLLSAVYGNCPAWLVKMGIESAALLRPRLDNFHQCFDLADYLAVSERLLKWLVSDVPARLRAI